MAAGEARVANAGERLEAKTNTPRGPFGDAPSHVIGPSGNSRQGALLVLGDSYDGFEPIDELYN